MDHFDAEFLYSKIISELKTHTVESEVKLE